MSVDEGKRSKQQRISAEEKRIKRLAHRGQKKAMFSIKHKKVKSKGGTSGTRENRRSRKVIENGSRCGESSLIGAFGDPSLRAIKNVRMDGA